MSAQKNKKFAFKYFIYDFVKYTAAWPGFIAFRPKVIFESKTARKHVRGGALLIANHISYLDPVYLMYAMWYRRLHIIALKELFDTKAKAFWFSRFLVIPVDRENFSMASFKQIVTLLKNEQMVAIFPEGKIKTDRDEKVQTFKSGMILMALQSGKPIVPICIAEKKHWFSRVVMALGEPIDVRKECGLGANMEQIEAVTKKLHDKEIELKEMLEKRRRNK